MLGQWRKPNLDMMGLCRESKPEHAFLGFWMRLLVFVSLPPGSGRM